MEPVSHLEGMMPTVHVNDMDTYYEIHGEGEPLVLILGLANDISEVHGIIGVARAKVSRAGLR